ncbi:sigma-54-dependent Fis family transcriptional regulator [Marinithermofilum abyssi]|uniref:Sigma-54-dependent Fis family transcriptional regulator n=1 Tax=Marinithermofilum abyssi TaxID=1571185 RepID=A0A8J2VFM5_9BACL|nr:sigma 54-interacting transcriptional regulator [Marinithermofilum abyssi]GGE04460.1 sigma-54-dependent Fis family transcriptional regulator [Marinithermofilum abyssi]
MYWERINARDRFMATKEISSEIRNPIAESWMRSSKHQVNPLLPRAPKTLSKQKLIQLQKSKAIGQAFQSISPNIQTNLDDKYAVALSDHSGQIIYLQANGRLYEGLESVNFIPGGNWSETICGTNAIGTSLASKTPVTIYDAEHYCEPWQPFSCVGVPIWHPVTGQVLGALDFTTFTEDFPDNGLILTNMLAKNIETELYYQYRLKIARLENAFLEWDKHIQYDRVFVIDREGNVVRRNHMDNLNRAKAGIRKDFDWDNYFSHLETKYSTKTTPSEESLPFLPGQPIGKILPVYFDHLLIGAVFQTPAIHLSHTMKTHAMNTDKSSNDLTTPWADILSAQGVVGRSRGWLAMLQKVKKAASQDITILLTGESGTGKEVLAQFIHENSFRKDKPFIPVNCASLNHDLTASELFGYGKGTFTGGLKEGKAGLFECADGGTLFLDEIGELPLSTQSMLLRVLQEKQVTRIGEQKLRSVDVRLIAATNKNVREAVHEGTFRSDLYYRLNTISFTVPPLRERKEDIPVLAEYFMRKFEKKKNVETTHILAPETIERLERYDWPGNVRELKNTVEYALVFTESSVIELKHLPPFLLEDELCSTDPSFNASMGKEISNEEREYILRLLQSTKYNISKTARIMGISRGTLYKRLKQYDLR